MTSTQNLRVGNMNMPRFHIEAMDLIKSNDGEGSGFFPDSLLILENNKEAIKLDALYHKDKNKSYHRISMYGKI